jgi:Fic family protein
MFEALTQAKEWLVSYQPLPFELDEALRSRFEVNLTYHSNALAGNTFNEHETRVILQDARTIGGRSLAQHLEVLGHKEALDFVEELVDEGRALGEREIRKIHGRIMRGQGHVETGEFRTVNLKFQGAPDYAEIPALMGELAHWLGAPSPDHPIALAAEAHQRFMAIRPFRDGNGRVARLLINHVLRRSGYPVAVIRVQDRDAYLAAQSAPESTDLQTIIARAVEASLRESLELCTKAQLLSDCRGAVQLWLAAPREEG